jgi:hypothetical protein
MTGEIQNAIDAAYAKYRRSRRKNADYIPALANVDPVWGCPGDRRRHGLHGWRCHD